MVRHRVPVPEFQDMFDSTHNDEDIGGMEFVCKHVAPNVYKLPYVGFQTMTFPTKAKVWDLSREKGVPLL